MPVHNGIDVIDRAIRSLQGQTLHSWELVAIDDGSTDCSYDRLVDWSRLDGRIHVSRTTENRGPAAARNDCMRRSVGEMITYLDCDDEFYPDFLEKIAHFTCDGGVLVFGYDVVDDVDPDKSIQYWDPRPYKNILFAGNVAAPLGVAHRRDLSLQVGGFNEDLWGLEDWELWKRMARAGAEFLFLPFRSGVYHKRARSRSRSPHLTKKQFASIGSRIASGLPLYRDACASGRKVHSVLLLTSAFPFGTSMGPPISAAEGAQVLARSGFTCQGFCLSKWTVGDDANFERVLADSGMPVVARDTTLGPHAARMVFTREGNIPLSAFRTSSTKHSEYSDGEGGAILDYFEKFLLDFRPDAVIACNPSPQPDLVFDLMFQMGKTLDVPMVLWLDGESAINLAVLQNADYCVVNSEAMRRRYWDAMGMVCHALPHVFDWDRVFVRRGFADVVTILASSTVGDSLLSSKITEKVSRIRPDIPVVVLGQDWHISASFGKSCVCSAVPLGNSERPMSRAEVYSKSKLVVVPSLGGGSFDRSVAEAMINGIPVIVSDRHSLQEIAGDAGVVIHIPACYQADTKQAPRADDISPWVDAIIRLWDDSEYCTEVLERCISYSQRWHPRRTSPVHVEFFRNLRPQPGPPVLPRWSDTSLAGLHLPPTSQSFLPR
jgi:Glycosyl transferase family 2/Glycosyl transferases group 1